MPRYRTRSCDMFALLKIHEVIEGSQDKPAIPVKFDWRMIAVELAEQICHCDDIHQEDARLVLKLHKERS